MTFKDKHALETLPAEIDRLRAEIARCMAVLSDAALYTKDPAKFDATSKAMTQAQNALEAAETRWLELEMLREEIES